MNGSKESSHPWSAILFGTTRMTIHALWQLMELLPSLGFLSTQALMGKGRASRQVSQISKVRTARAF